MGLLGDIKETTENWKEKSISFKLISILGFFLAISSITSLADTIIGWKGFIKDGLNFYQTFFSKSIKELISFSRFSYTSVDIDTLTFISLSFITILRQAYLECKNEEIPRKTFHLLTVIFSSIFFVFAIYLGFSSLTGSNTPLIISGSVFAFSVIWAYQDKKFQALMIPLFAVVTVFILAAINKGLTA
jgi:hypothetical protein